VSWPVPRPGLVIRYSYLWESEARLGREEGVKDRPCAIVLVILRPGANPIVRVLPVTAAISCSGAPLAMMPAMCASEAAARLGADQ
jgi:hypothetical protein